jgi:hypothetical protein
MTRSFEKKSGRRKKIKSVSFNPNHEYLENAVQNFIKKGGEVKKIENISEDHEEFMNRYQSHIP